MGEPSSFNHSTKRRRTVAPQMDGKSRGMNYSDGDVDNDTDEDEDNFFENSNSEDRDEAPSGWEERAGQYKDVNQLLHQLHLEQQRRSRLATSSSNTLSPCPQPLHPQHTSLPHPSKQLQRTSDCFPRTFEGSPPGVQPTSLDNADEVWTNYEANNRLLGSIIRHRHRLQEHGEVDEDRN